MGRDIQDSCFSVRYSNVLFCVFDPVWPCISSGGKNIVLNTFRVGAQSLTENTSSELLIMAAPLLAISELIGSPGQLIQKILHFPGKR